MSNDSPDRKPKQLRPARDKMVPGPGETKGPGDEGAAGDAKKAQEAQAFRDYWRKRIRESKAYGEQARKRRMEAYG